MSERQPTMDNAAAVSARMNALHEAVWELAAVAIVGRQQGTNDELRRAAEQVLLNGGWLMGSEDAPRPSPGADEITGGDWSRLAAQASSGILQSAAVLSGADLWTNQNDEALLAQGHASAQGAQPFKNFAVPMMPGLGELLSSPSPVMLDIGVGVAAMAIAYCDLFPRLRVVGLDVFPRVLDIARRTVDQAGLSDRIELRLQDIAAIDEREAFCLAWLPAPFVPRAAIEAGLPRTVSALVPGGWLMIGHGKFEHGLSGALTRLQTVAFGGTALDDEEAQELLGRSGLEQVMTFPTPEGAPGITVGRRPDDP